MKNIFFRKIFQYDPTCEQKYSKYEGYCKITLGIENPPIIVLDNCNIDNIKYDLIYSSTLIRAQQSSKLYKKKSNNRIINTYKLNEIIFDLNKLVSE